MLTERMTPDHDKVKATAPTDTSAAAAAADSTADCH